MASKSVVVIGAGVVGVMARCTEAEAQGDVGGSPHLTLDIHLAIYCAFVRRSVVIGSSSFDVVMGQTHLWPPAVFDRYYKRKWVDSLPVLPDALAAQ